MGGSFFSLLAFRLALAIEFSAKISSRDISMENLIGFKLKMFVNYFLGKVFKMYGHGGTFSSV